MAELGDGIEPPALIYHYTTAEGLRGIVANSELWATDIRFLNDAEEITYAFGLLTEHFEALLPDDLGENTEYMDGRAGHVAMENLSHFNSDYRCYVACLSAADDLLSQWRAYAAQHGYCIAFDTGAIKDAGYQAKEQGLVEHFDLVRVRYDTDEVDGFLAFTAARLEAIQTGHPGMYGWYESLAMLPLLASIKNAAFAEEAEWRMVLSDTAYPGPPLDFRASHYGLVPYVRVPVPNAAIRRVRVAPGPYAELRVEGVRELLANAGIRDVAVVKSAAPFRG